jgi:hypothetical protein
MNIGKWNMPVPRHRSDFDEYSVANYGEEIAKYKDSQYAYHPTSDRIRNFYSIFRFKFDPNYGQENAPSLLLENEAYLLNETNSLINLE